MGGAEAKDCSGGRRGGFPSSWGRPAAGCCLCGKEPQSLQHERDRASVSQNQVPGEWEQSDSRGIICVKRPSLT